MDWSEERTATLKKLWLEGLSASQVARQLGGVSRSAVIGKVHRLGITVRETPVRQRVSTARAPSRIAVRQRPSRESVPQRIAPRFERVEEDLLPTSGILGLGAHSCRWPIGHPENDDFGFCGRPKTSARGSYCEQHSQGAFRRLGSTQAVEAWALKGVKEKRVQSRLV
ncbi:MULTISPECIES: GcrA family cell cycle regulator [unclassified Caulobacter]|jgi:GcrA cell cycle regulator|uniref:GcrA family cell cycle regulator n=1 Tax=unclassified Caulobacter TaxID=2648921 RepID=UPI0007809A3E|nr:MULTISPECIES: GcrA family cell cycle regulator [unclassified Caulobacter]AZS20836.1 GcrA cell cycle regulator [Caulobacter sp. FWC26]